MKAYSKRAKRRNKGYRALCERQERQDPVISAVEPDDPQKTVREARARQTGRPEKEVVKPIYCEQAGRAIMDGAKDRDEAGRMWSRFSDFDRADAIYATRVLGKHRFPNVAKMEFLPNRVEADPDEKPDLRSEDEKHRDAVNAWMTWQGYLGRLHAFQRSSIVRAARQMDTLHDGGITVHGQSFVAAMRALCDVVDAATNRR